MLQPDVYLYYRIHFNSCCYRIFCLLKLAADTLLKSIFLDLGMAIESLLLKSILQIYAGWTFVLGFPFLCASLFLAMLGVRSLRIAFKTSTVLDQE
jgi:hypothetical protein